MGLLRAPKSFEGIFPWCVHLPEGGFRVSKSNDIKGWKYCRRSVDSMVAYKRSIGGIQVHNWCLNITKQFETFKKTPWGLLSAIVSPTFEPSSETSNRPCFVETLLSSRTCSIREFWNLQILKSTHTEIRNQTYQVVDFASTDGRYWMRNFI